MQYQEYLPWNAAKATRLLDPIEKRDTFTNSSIHKEGATGSLCTVCNGEEGEIILG